MAIVSAIVSFVAVVGIAVGQQSCRWYNWNQNDWAPTNQNFSQTQYAKTHPHSYLDSTSFASGGYFYGKKWQDVFFSNPWYYRPLGFRYGILGAWNVPTICINATGAGNYLVELMAYSFTPGASLAATDLATDPFNLQSNAVMNTFGKSKLYQCFQAPTDSQSALLLSIYCPRTNCQEGETHLLWRLRRSTTSFEQKGSFGNPEMWCMTIGSNIQWPDQIVDTSPKSYSNANQNEYQSGALQVSVMLGTLLSIVFALFQ